MTSFHPTNSPFNDAYRVVIYNILRKGVLTPSRIGNQYLLKHLVYGVDGNFDPRVVTSSPRKPNYEYAEAFASWILSGSTEMDPVLKELSPQAINFDATQEDMSAYELPENFSAFYGPRIARQVDDVAEELVASKDTRRAFVGVLDGLNDNKLLKPLREKELTKVEYPCTIGFMFDVEYSDRYQEDVLNITAYMRSQNCISVLPYDFYIAWKFLRLMSKKTGYHVGTINGVIHHAHVFERDLDQANFLVNE